MSGDESYSLVKGSVYRVVSAGTSESSVETVGDFLGYQQFGDESALAVRLNSGEKSGSVRIIPCSAVLYVDVIRQEKEAAKKKSTNEKVEFYG